MLSQDRQLQSSAEWRKQMAEVDRSVFTQLRDGIKGGFDEDRFGSRIGFGNLKRCVVACTQRCSSIFLPPCQLGWLLWHPRRHTGRLSSSMRGHNKQP